MGRHSEPTEIKKQKGTLRKHRETPNAMSGRALSNVPYPPDDLPERAKQEWFSVATDLQSMGLLFGVDLSLLKAYCYQIYVLDLAQEELKAGYTIIMQNKGGGMYPVKSPWVAIYNEALSQAKSLAQQFGFTPSARTKISLNQVKEEENNPWDEI